MSKLQIYLKNLTPRARKELAARANTSPIYLHQLMVGQKTPGASIAARLESASAGEIRRIDIRPDLFADQNPTAAGLIHVSNILPRAIRRLIGKGGADDGEKQEH